MDTDRLHPFTGLDLGGEKHWWLQDLDTKERFDLTSVQHTLEKLEYFHATGKPKKLYSFQGRRESRFMDLMELVQPNAKRYSVSKHAGQRVFSNKRKRVVD